MRADEISSHRISRRALAYVLFRKIFMSADYVLKFPCEVRKDIPEEKLVVLVGYMNLAEHLMKQIRQQDPSVSTDTILNKYEVHVSQTRPDGTRHQIPMTILELLKAAQPIREYRAHCNDCRANISDTAFGCIAKINYPIRSEVEEWLLRRLPDDVNDPELATLFRFLSDLDIDGAHVDASRSNIFELQQGLVRRWGSGSQQKQISSSQLIHMLLFGGDIAPPQANLYTRLLGLSTVLSEAHPPSSNIEQFKTFMCATVMAGRLNARISVDY
jgi:hypothetical protein